MYSCVILTAHLFATFGYFSFQYHSNLLVANYLSCTISIKIDCFSIVLDFPGSPPPPPPPPPHHSPFPLVADDCRKTTNNTPHPFRGNTNNDFLKCNVVEIYYTSPIHILDKYIEIFQADTKEFHNEMISSRSQKKKRKKKKS